MLCIYSGINLFAYPDASSYIQVKWRVFWSSSWLRGLLRVFLWGLTVLLFLQNTDFTDYWHTYNILFWRVWSFECSWNVSNTFNPFIVYAYGFFKSELRLFKSRDCHCWMFILCRWLSSSYCRKVYLCPSQNLLAKATSDAAKIFGFLADFSRWHWFWLELERARGFFCSIAKQSIILKEGILKPNNHKLSTNCCSIWHLQVFVACLCIDLCLSFFYLETNYIYLGLGVYQGVCSFLSFLESTGTISDGKIKLCWDLYDYIILLVYDFLNKNIDI